MSVEGVEYLDNLIKELAWLRCEEADRPEDAADKAFGAYPATPLASMVLEAAMRPFPGVLRVGIMELTMFKMTIKTLPESCWPTPDALKKP